MFLDSEHYNPVSCRREEGAGSIRLNSEYVTHRKPAWLVLLKLCGLAAMVAVAVAIAWPSLRPHFAPLQCATLIAGAIFIYSGLAFFFRPEPNPDNMGFLGGIANDPTQYSDDVNRKLWNLHCLLGPGRYASETLLDTCVLVGLASSEEIIDPSIETEREAVISNAVLSEATFSQGEAISRLETTTLRADRFEA